MKNLLLSLCGLLVLAAPLPASDSTALDPNLIVLDATGVQNLRLQTVPAMPADFEETIFALGRIELYPGRRAVVSSRIAGRALEVLIKTDHAVKKGDPAVIVESRQVGDPPPRITLTAPISGLVSSTSIVPGEPVSPDKILAEIIDLEEVYALARVPEHLAGQLKKGQSARITVSAVTGEVFTAELEHMGATADAANGVIEAAFHVDNPELKLRPGMRAEFSIVTSRRTGVTSVPRSALQGDPAGRFVYVKDFDLPTAFVKTPVVVGQSNDRFVEIISGLLPADEVVTQGAYSLAFAGGGSTSLKEALDAAHGHAHNADGSEVSGNDKATTPEADHDHGEADHARLWKIASGVLLVALITVSLLKRRGAKPANP